MVKALNHLAHLSYLDLPYYGKLLYSLDQEAEKHEILFCVISFIMNRFDESFSIGDSSTILGICLIFLGSIFLIGYNYYIINDLAMKSEVNETTLDYLKNINKQIKSKNSAGHLDASAISQVKPRKK